VIQNDRFRRRPDASAILRATGHATYRWDLAADTLIWSDNAAELLGTAITEIGNGKGYAQHVATDGQTRFDAVMNSGLRDAGTGVPYQLEYAFRATPEAAPVWIEDSGSWFVGPEGTPAYAQGVVRIVTARHEREQALTQKAQFDPLTGELNRIHLVDVLRETFDDAVRFKSSCGFLMIAIDNLGQLNQAYGFAVADEVIAQVAKRLRSVLRGKDKLGVFSGNKFGVILTNCTPEELDIAADRLITAVRSETVPTSAGPVAVTVTAGGVNAPRHARSVEEILARALDALAGARARRHGSFAAYKPNIELEAQRKENVRATDEIVAALNERRIQLAFEPVVGAANRNVAFYECLMRVQRPDGGLASANEIVPIAERIGLVRMLDHRVLELVVKELNEFPQLNASVNVSPGSTNDPGWWLGLGAMLKAYPAVAQRLTVEITETTAIRDIDDARGFVARVKDLGCRIAIDDFGAGFTSFRNLRKLGVDMVKIDGAFVQNILRNEDDRAFVQTLIELARRLGLKTVAEWVQDEETAKLLLGWGCDYLQGALVGLATNDRPWRDEAPRIAASA